MKKVLTMRYPSSWHGEMWREGAPCGNGTVGALVYGGADDEYILLNHTQLWHGGTILPMPDVSASLSDVRRHLDDERPDLAASVFREALHGAGYKPMITTPFPLCDIRIRRNSENPITGYRRKVFFERAEVTVSWQENGVQFTRSTFVSRLDGLMYTNIRADQPGKISLSAWLDLHDPETMPEGAVRGMEKNAAEDMLFYAAENETVYVPAKGDFGAVMQVRTKGGIVTAENDTVTVENADEVTLVTGVFIGKDRASGWADTAITVRSAPGYEDAFALHQPLHIALYSGAEFSISDGDSSAEEMLMEAYDTGASNELMETMYAYGRYLFVCATGDKDEMPVHLTGLWCGTYRCFWAFHMFNVNFEMIYWQALSGNQPALLRKALDYVEAMVPDFRENAKKIFGCRGIYLNSVNTPESGLSVINMDHIINWTAGAAWVSQHFYDYYRFTGDEAYLRYHALPFMADAALFLEDFLRTDKSGKYEFSPATSPENTPSSTKTLFDSNSRVTKNASMDIACTRELLTNLLEGSRITGLYAHKRETWETMLSLLPDYKYNSDGSLKEWADDFYTDNNAHRHQSHLYGVFPGHSIRPGTKEFAAADKAEENRLALGLRAQSSWSCVYMAGVFSRLGKGDRAWLALSEMLRNCCMGNLFTLHNDWRRTGAVCCDDLRIAPFQIDANIGFPAAVNEMLITSADGDITLLPALPGKWKNGSIGEILTVGGHRISLRWNETEAEVKVICGWQNRITLKSGKGWRFTDGSTEKTLNLAKDEAVVLKLNQA